MQTPRGRGEGPGGAGLRRAGSLRGVSVPRGVNKPKGKQNQNWGGLEEQMGGFQRVCKVRFPRLADGSCEWGPSQHSFQIALVDGDPGLSVDQGTEVAPTGTPRLQPGLLGRRPLPV